MCGKSVERASEWEWILDYKCLQFCELEERVYSLISCLVVSTMAWNQSGVGGVGVGGIGKTQ